jgi:hypothetical protein
MHTGCQRSSVLPSRQSRPATGVERSLAPCGGRSSRTSGEGLPRRQARPAGPAAGSTANRRVVLTSPGQMTYSEQRAIDLCPARAF